VSSEQNRVDDIEILSKEASARERFPQGWSCLLLDAGEAAARQVGNRSYELLWRMSQVNDLIQSGLPSPRDIRRLNQVKLITPSLMR